VIVPGVGYVHGIVPVHERGHDHGVDHDHVPGYVFVHDHVIVDVIVVVIVVVHLYAAPRFSTSSIPIVLSSSLGG
jgi:hypothetical protein